MSRTGVSPSDCLVSYPGHSLKVAGVLPLCRDAVGLFYNSNQEGERFRLLSEYPVI